MSHNESGWERPAVRKRRSPAYLALAAVVGIAFAVLAGVVQAQLLMAPSARDLLLLSGYFVIAGSATLGVGWILLAVSLRMLNLSISARILIVVFLAIAVALLNIVIVAQGMFVSTAHDLRLLFAILVFTAIITGLFGLLVVRSLALRIEPIRYAIRRLARGELTSRVVVVGRDEVAELALELNLLAERLSAADVERNALDRERKELTAAVSHDLRTPLASLRAMVEALKDGVVRDEKEVDRYLATMGREIDRLGQLIDDLFELARIDAGAVHFERRVVDLAEIAADVADSMRVQAENNDVVVRMSADPGVPSLSLDGAKIERAVANLLRNAIEHTPKGGQIEVSVKVVGGEVELAVADNGEGVPESETARVWERFYRGEKSRTRAAGSAEGAGLGLAIVRGIVEAHGGAVTAESRPGSGARFAFKLPIKSAA